MRDQARFHLKCPRCLEADATTYLTVEAGIIGRGGSTRFAVMLVRQPCWCELTGAVMEKLEEAALDAWLARQERPYVETAKRVPGGTATPNLSERSNL